MNRLLTPFEVHEDHVRYTPPEDFEGVDIGSIMDAFNDLDTRTAPSRKGAPLRLLCDTRFSRNPARADRRPMYERHHEFNDRRVAILGNTTIQKILLDFILAATGHRGHVRFFTDETEALAWLRGQDAT